MGSKCKVCGTQLVRSADDVDIDVCPACGTEHCWDEGFVLRGSWAAEEIRSLRRENKRLYERLAKVETAWEALRHIEKHGCDPSALPGAGEVWRRALATLMAAIQPNCT